VAVTRVEAEHLPVLAEFYRRVWDPAATPQGVAAARARAAAANPVAPGEPPPTWIVLREDRAIGHVTTIPITLWLDGRDQPAHWIKGLWVLPEFQRSAVGFLVLRAAVQELGTSLALVHEPAAVRLFGALGFTDLGGLPNDLRVLRARSLLRKLDLDALALGAVPAAVRPLLRWATAGAGLAAPVLDLATRLWAGIASGPAGRHTITMAESLDVPGSEALWQAVQSEVGAGTCRGGSELAARYSADDYVFVHVRDAARLVGLAIVKRPRAEGDARLRGIRIATLSDLLYAPSQPRTGLAVLRGAEAAAVTLDADALLCGASAAAVRNLARRRGFLPLPSNLHVLARAPDEAPARLDAWWVTRGDSGGDGVF
jgi:hypothetical protein